MNIKTICITSLFAFVVIFGAVAFAPQALALGTGGCTTDCGGGDGGTGGGGGDGGGDSSNPPICNISLSAKTADIGDKFTLTWNGTPSNATFEINNDPVSDSGSATYTFPSGYSSIRYVMTGVNGDGNCVKEVVIKRTTPTVKPTCDIVANISEVTVGGKYKITWTGTPADGIFKINGEGVSPTGSATYTFVGPNTETFTFTGETSGGTCSDKVTVTKKPEVVVPPTCDISANLSVVEVGDKYKITWVGTPTSASFKINGAPVAASGSATYTFVGPNTETFTLKGNNTAGSCTDAVTVKVQPAAPTPSCILTATPSTIASGASSKLTWTSKNAVAGSIDGGVGTIVVTDTSGVSVTPTATRVYTMTVKNADGVKVTCTRTVTVTIPVPTPSCILSATPSTIAQGASSKLTWTSQNTSGNATIDRGIGEVDPRSTNSRSVSPTATTLYTMTVENSAGVKATCSRTVTVTPPTPTATCILTATPNNMVAGGSVKLKWTTTNAVSGSIDGGVGTIVLTNTAGVSVSPTATKIYTMTVQNSKGEKATCSEKVTVTATPAPTCILTATPTSITAGSMSKLTWVTTNSASVSIDQGVGVVTGTTAKNVTPKVTTTYTMTVKNSVGAEANCSAKVTVTAPTPAPTCILTATPNNMVVGGSVKLTWTSTNTSGTATIDRGIGEVDPTRTTNYRMVSPTATTIYTMTVQNSAGVKATCSEKVTVTEAPAPMPTCILKATPNNMMVGGSVKLTWTSTNTSGNATIDRGVGEVDPHSTNSRTVSPTVTTIYTMTVENEDGKQATCSEKVTVTATPPAVCTLTATPASIVSGNSSKLTWTSQNTSGTATIDHGIGEVDPTRTENYRIVAPTATTTYTMTVKNVAGDKTTCTATIKVTKAPAPLPTCTLSANPTTVEAGKLVTLSWNLTNMDSAVITDGTVSHDIIKGKNTVVWYPQATKTYTLTVKNVDGKSAVCTTIITVTPPAPDAAICNSFTAFPTTINRGQSTTLTWNTTNANSNGVSIDNAIGQVNPDGSVVVSPTETSTYTLTANGIGGNTRCQATVSVIQPDFLSCSDNVSFTATDYDIDEDDSTTLIWSTTGVTSVSITNLSSTGLSGSESVSPNSDTTYILTAQNGSESISCPVTINVDEEDDDDNDNDSDNPRCELDLSDESISRGDRVTLSWETSDATEITIEDNHGQTIVSTDDMSSSDRNDFYDGEISLRPEEDTTYTIIAENGSEDRTCSVSVDVRDSLTVLETRTQYPVVTGISLTQVPYTGFEAGPFLTMLFYGLLLLWALYLTYILVIRRNSIGGVALATVAPETPVTGSTITSEHARTDVVASTMSTPRFVAPVAAAAAVATPVVGYAQMAATRDDAYDAVATHVEDMAHAERVLLSSEAMRQFIDSTTTANRDAELTAVLATAKASFPSEDGWVVLNLERMNSVYATSAATPVPTISVFTPATIAAGNSSLAEAIVTGNIVAAYQMIGARPMVSLAEAAAELDALYRAKQGGEVVLSGLLQTEGAQFSLEQVKAAIAALTSALDGTYSEEGEAVKMAILKAIKALA